MKGRPIVVVFLDEPRSLSEVGRLIGVAPRTMSHRYAKGKRGSALFAPADERCKRRGNWGLGDVVESRVLCKMATQ